MPKPHPLDEFADAQGRVGGPLPVATLFPPPPEASLRGDDIRYRIAVNWQKPHQPPVDLLERFLRLVTPASFLRFAKQFGVLHICEHDLPASHSHGCFPVIENEPTASFGIEPLDVWRRLQRTLGGMLRVATALRERRPPDDVDDWIALTQFRSGIDERNPVVVENFAKLVTGPNPHALEWLALQQLEREANALIAIAELTPALSWTGERFDLHVTSRVPDGLSLFGALVLQMVAAVSGSRFAVCSACGAPYVPRRRPAAGRRRYCSACGRSAAVRDAKAAHRARLKVGRRNH